MIMFIIICMVMISVTENKIRGFYDAYGLNADRAGLYLTHCHGSARACAGQQRRTRTAAFDSNNARCCVDSQRAQVNKDGRPLSALATPHGTKVSRRGLLPRDNYPTNP